MSPAPPAPDLRRQWSAVLAGAVAGVVFATAIVLAVAWFGEPPAGPGVTSARPDSPVPLFRLDASPAHELLLVPAGPDALGEPGLAHRLFGDAPPRRELAALLLANVADQGDWDVDLRAPALRARTAPDAAWLELEPVPPELVDRALDASGRLRARSIGGGLASVRVGPHSLRQVLLALPPGWRLHELSDVQWGERPLQRADTDVEGLHAYREGRTDLRR